MAWLPDDKKIEDTDIDRIPARDGRWIERRTYGRTNRGQTDILRQYSPRYAYSSRDKNRHNISHNDIVSSEESMR